MTELTVIDCAQPPPPPNGEGTQLVSLSAELSMLEDALTAAANIAELLAMKSLPSDEAAAQAPIAIGAVLTLLITRSTHLRRAMLCEADPIELLAPHNSVPENELGDPDVRLRPWTAAQRIIHLRRLLAKAEAEAKREEPTPPSP
ncbi:MAG TPA: hypothetical protein VGB96_05615, partial [Archangium sp.]